MKKVQIEKQEHHVIEVLETIPVLDFLAETEGLWYQQSGHPSTKTGGFVFGKHVRIRNVDLIKSNPRDPHSNVTLIMEDGSSYISAKTYIPGHTYEHLTTGLQQFRLGKHYEDAPPARHLFSWKEWGWNVVLCGVDNLNSYFPAEPPIGDGAKWYYSVFLLWDNGVYYNHYATQGYTMPNVTFHMPVFRPELTD